MTDVYANWKRRVAGEKVPMHDGEVDCGFYRQKNKDKETKVVTWEPVAFFEIEGALCGVRGCEPNQRSLSTQQCGDLWTFVCQHPITEEQYRAVAERGEPWHDSHEEKPKARKSAKVSESTAAHPAPDGAKPASPDKVLADEIEEAKKKLATYATIESDEMSSKARSLQQFFLDKRSAAKKEYDALNNPLLAQQKKIREIWFPLRDAADESAASLKLAIEKWEDFKREQQRKADAERDRLQREHDAAVKAAEAANKPAPAPPPEPVKPNAPAPAAQIRGGTGRAAAVTVWHEVVIDDIMVVLTFLKENPAVLTVALSEAQKKQNAGISVPGTHTVERSKIR